MAGLSFFSKYFKTLPFKHCLALLPFLCFCSVKTSKLNLFKFSTDPSIISVFGLYFTSTTSHKQPIAPFFSTQESGGGVAFHPQLKIVYTADNQGQLTAFDTLSQKILFTYQHTAAFSSKPLFVNQHQLVGAAFNMLVVGAQDGHLLAINANSGQLVWTYQSGAEIKKAPTLANGLLVFNNAANQLIALDVNTGKWIWQYQRDFPDRMVVMGHAGALVKDGVVYTGFSDGVIAAVKLEDGMLIWSKALNFQGQRFFDADATPYFYNQTLFVSAYEDGVFALNPQDGQIKWRTQETGVVGITVYDDLLVTVSAEGRCRAFDIQDGRELWKFSFSPARVTEPVQESGYVAFGTYPGGLYILDTYSGRLIQRFNVGGINGELTLTNKHLGFVSEAGYVYLLHYAQDNSLLVRMPHPHMGL